MAAPKLPKSIIKKYGITKKAWEVFRRSRGAKKTSARAAKSGGEKMARKKGTRRRRAVAAAKRTYRKGRAALDTKPGRVVGMAVTAAAGGVASSLVVNKTPILRDQGKVTKSLLQGAVGLGAIMFVRNRHVKSLGAGAVIASAMGLAQDLFRVQALAGPSAGRPSLTPSEMRRLTSGQMQMPLRDAGRMSAPLSTAPANAGFRRTGFGG